MIIASRLSSSAKYVFTDRFGAGPSRLSEAPDRSASCQEASTTTGTKITDSPMRTSATPSTPTAQCTPNCWIHQYDWENWNRGPFASNWIAMTRVSAATTSETANAAHLASASAPLG